MNDSSVGVPLTAGPANRESFFAAQARNRRATWRMAALCAASAAIMGIPLALIVTPLLYACFLIGADVVSLWAPLPPDFWKMAGDLARTGITAVNWLVNHQPADLPTLGLGAAVLLVPGVVLSIVLWTGMNALFHRAGVGGALLALRAREPNPGDLKELRLADVVQEMAVASGLPAPRVLLVDAPGANAAAIGTSPADARIVISRAMIETLTRDELEGALGHLVASIGNGDLRIAFRVTALFETLGALVALVNSPFGSRSRRTLWRIFRYGLLQRSKNAEPSAEEAQAVAEILLGGAGLGTDDIDRLFDTTSSKRSLLRSLRNFLLFPIFFTNTAIKLTLYFFSLTILEPSVALLWRTRRYLADATTVQLTRNPDGLAGALQKLSADGGTIPGGEWARYLFLVKPHPAAQERMPQATPQQLQKLAEAWTRSAPAGSSAANPEKEHDFAALQKQFAATWVAAKAGDSQAQQRIAAFGLTVAEEADPALKEELRQHDSQSPLNGNSLRTTLGDLGVQNSSSAVTSAQHSTQENPFDGFISFHPPLNRRLKRLARMGAHIDLSQKDRVPWKIELFFTIFLAPFAILIAGLFLVLIAAMTMASLTFLVVWLAVIHKVFLLFARH
jgi:Zn-dependent protease with chaperone function